MSSHRSCVGRLAACLAAGILASSLTAQTPISGALSGTLSPGVYVVTGGISVQSGQTLTLAPGVIVKFNGAYQFVVNGTLVCNGTSGSPVIFTDYADDSAGGDTNGNGPSVGAPGAWYNLSFGNGSDASSLTWTEVRFGGASNFIGIDLNQADISMDRCTVRDCQARAINLRTNSLPTITNSSVLDNGGRAFDNVPVDAVPLITNITSSGNSLDTLRITAGTISSNLTLGTASMIDGAFLFASNISIQSGVTLTVPAGVNVKFEGARQVIVNGTLDCQGTAVSPVIFTDDLDDSAGGDTNNDGPSSGVTGSWYNLSFGSQSDASTLSHTEVRYGGASNFPGIDLNQADVAVGNCTVRDCQARAINLRTNSLPTITNSSVLDNGGRAFDNVPVDAVPLITNITSSGNSLDTLRITAGTISSNLTLGTASMIDGAFLFASNISIQSGVTLTVPAGVNVKFEGARQVIVNGTLDCQGTAVSPVIFTDDLDDSAGGDTNNDGPSSGVTGSWYNLNFGSTSDASTLTHTEVRYGGASNFTAVDLNQADIAMSNCVVRDCQRHGLRLRTNSHPTVTECSFDDNAGQAVDDVPLTAIPGFMNNTASGNGSNCMRVTGGTVSGSLTIGTQSMLGGAFLMSIGISVQTAGDLKIEQGCVFKMTGALQCIFNGAVEMNGTGYEPIVFTDDDDDSIAGDSTGNGPSTGQAGAWYNLDVSQSASSASMENVLVRYGGASNFAAVDVRLPGADLRAVRVDEAQAVGFRLVGLTTNPKNLVAWSCGGHGIHLENGSNFVMHATCSGNGGDGIRAEASWTGTVANTNSWGNSAEYSGLTTGQVINCNGGFVGFNGNIDQDPLFEDAANGDLHLQSTSPCLGAGHTGVAGFVAKDWDENPRSLDHALVGSALPDIGAYERGNWHMAVAGTPRPGETVFLTVQGPPGESFLGFGLNDGNLFIAPYGQLLTGTAATTALVFPFSIAVGTPIPLTVPNDPGLAGTIIGLQALNFPTGSLVVGNFSELYRPLVRP